MPRSTRKASAGSVVVPDLESYRKFQSTHLTKKNGITSVKTDVPSQIIKQSYQLPLEDL